MKKKIALITGITGQDGSYLAEFLLKKNYIVHGIKRKSSSFNTDRIDHIYKESFKLKNFFLHYGDLTDYSSIEKIVKKIKPNEIYNLAAQSHVATSFELPVYTTEVNALGTLKILEVIKNNNKKIKFYQASSSEMFGRVQKKIQNEKTSFYPLSPYATSKLYAYWITKNYRESYGLFACNGILFNHESPRRGETFVTRKITNSISRICFGLENRLYLGNIYSLRDWGNAKDYVEMQWKMLQQKKPDDYIISSGSQYSVKQFVNMACNELKIKIQWTGKGIKEKALILNFDKKISPALRKGQIIVQIKKKYFRPNDVINLIGNCNKAIKKLNWKPKKNILPLIKEMIVKDYLTAANLFKSENFKK